MCTCVYVCVLLLRKPLQVLLPLHPRPSALIPAHTFSLSLTLTHSLLLSLSLSLSLALSLSLSLSPSLTHTGTHTHTHTHLEQCGHVISEQAVRKLSRAGARFKCPYCPLEVSLAGSLALTF